MLLWFVGSLVCWLLFFFCDSATNPVAVAYLCLFTFLSVSAVDGAMHKTHLQTCREELLYQVQLKRHTYCFHQLLQKVIPFVKLQNALTARLVPLGIAVGGATVSVWAGGNLALLIVTVLLLSVFAVGFADSKKFELVPFAADAMVNI